ncbi:5-formyltetrahydrofolate cyclo-ligase [Massilia eurypsychrophila]|uniref:5-formyltetrahydrofolate cyclo-ligase n=1 Tax=Massilia eurypsychrophila TaxID=1485217 RepID=UPI001E5A8FE6|nr:5-formyltetrahydrofolate cyclo-ligase [Massilia eurypsychrophila]
MLRRSLALARASIDPARKARWDAAIGAQLLAWWRAQPVPALGVYWPLRGEADLSSAYAELAQAGVRLALPVVLARDAALGFADWQPGEAMVKDTMGVAVPADLRMVARPPALLVPCLGFNEEGYRLGYGGGYYDRTLELEPRPVTLGIAYACQAAQFASAAHDVALDRIITELA